MGQHLKFIRNKKEISDLGYESIKSVYRAQDCSKCPLRGKFVKAEFATVVPVHNIRKMVKNGYGLDSYDITTKKKVTKNYFLVTFFLSS